MFNMDRIPQCNLLNSPSSEITISVTGIASASLGSLLTLPSWTTSWLASVFLNNCPDVGWLVGKR